MHQRFPVSLVAVSAVLLISGCASWTSPPAYSASTANIDLIRAKLSPGSARVRVDAFTSSATLDSTPTCRAAGALNPAHSMTIPVYIRQALISELSQAGFLDPASNVAIQAKVITADVSTMSAARWTLSMQVSSQDNDGYVVTVEHPFPERFAAVSACQEAETAFNGAVERLIHATISDERFVELLRDK